MAGVLDFQPSRADRRIAYGAHPLQFGDLRLPSGPGPHPLVVAIHGGFWRARYDLEHLGHLCAALTGAGWATWSIEYRRIGQPGGGYPGTFQDVGRALDFVPELAREAPIRAAGVVVMGHSAGGHLALWAGGRHRLAPGSELSVQAPFRPGGVVSLAGLSRLAEAFRLRLGDGVVSELLGGPPDEQRERYASCDPEQLLPLGVPSVLVHGDEDEDVPFVLSEAFVRTAQARGDPARLERLSGMGHYEPIDPRSRAWAVVRDAVASAAPTL